MNLKFLSQSGTPRCCSALRFPPTLAASQARRRSEPRLYLPPPPQPIRVRKQLKRKISPDAIKKSQTDDAEKTKSTLPRIKKQRRSPSLTNTLMIEKPLKATGRKLVDLKNKYDSDINAILTPRTAKEVNRFQGCPSREE